MTRYLYYYATVILALTALAASLTYWRVHNHNNTSEASHHSEPGDLVCGPRCVQFVLRHYGKDENLIQLVREIQWPHMEAGATLASLSAALTARGVHTRALRIGSKTRLRWPHPVIVHLNAHAAGGHYVIWLPSSDSQIADVWVGLGGIQSGPADELARRCSGIVLLTAPNAILASDLESITPNGNPLPWLIAIVNGAALLILGARRRRQHTRNQSSSP